MRSLKLFPSCWETLRILLQFKMLECTDLRSHFLCFIVILDLWCFHMRYEYLPYWLVFILFVFIHVNSTHFSTRSHRKTLVMKKQSVCSSKSTQIDLFFNDRVFPPNSLFDYYFQTLKSGSSKFSNKYKYVWSCNIIYRKKNHKLKVGQMLAMSSHSKTKNKVLWFGVMGPAVLVGA